MSPPPKVRLALVRTRRLFAPALAILPLPPAKTNVPVSTVVPPEKVFFPDKVNVPAPCLVSPPEMLSAKVAVPRVATRVKPPCVSVIVGALV